MVEGRGGEGGDGVFEGEKGKRIVENEVGIGRMVKWEMDSWGEEINGV